MKRLKKLAIGLAKIGISAAIIAALVWLAWRKEPQAVESLRSGEKNWWMLAAAVGICFTAVMTTLLRWWFLVRTLGMPLRIRDALRIGFVGYLFNLAPMGIIGGDLLKAWMLGRQQNGRGAESLASVVVDRIIGMYALFFVAAVAILASGLWRTENPTIRGLSWTALAISAACSIGFALLIGSDVVGEQIARASSYVPVVGRTMEQVIREVRMYRHHRGRLAVALSASLAVHGLLVFTVYFIALGLPGRSPSLPQHFVAVPMAGALNAIPLPAGPQEGAFQVLYGELVDSPLKGLVVALTYRMTMVLIAAVGIVYYFASRREVAEVMHEHDDVTTAGG